MSKKKKKPASAQSAGESQKQQNNKGGSFGGILLGVIVALVIFRFSGASSGGSTGWTEGVGTIVSSYTITEEENKDEAGIYADVEFVDETGATRTERSNALKSELTDYVGKSMEIKYNPKGEGVTVQGFEAGSSLSAFQIILIGVIILVIFGVGEAIKKAMPTQEEYNQRRAARKKK